MASEARSVRAFASVCLTPVISHYEGKTISACVLVHDKKRKWMKGVIRASLTGKDIGSGLYAVESEGARRCGGFCFDTCVFFYSLESYNSSRMTMAKEG